MSTSRRKDARATTALVVASFAFTALCFKLLPWVCQPWNSQFIDKLFVLRASVSWLAPHYDNTIVHVDISNSTLQRLDDFYLKRSQFARAVRNLGEMRTAAQAYDFIFGEKPDDRDDPALVEATRGAGNAYFSLALALAPEKKPTKSELNPEVLRYLDASKWALSVDGDGSGLYHGSDPLPTFAALAAASRGLGFISIKIDMDGVVRRVPLLVRYEDGFFPSLPFRVICDYLKVPPENIRILPGDAVVLRGARRPGAEPHDVRIPIDRAGNMIVSFIGPWGAMKHYNFADVYFASDSRDELDVWRDELEGKIVVISDISTGATDLRPVPTDTEYPLSGMHANVLHTILTEDFFREVSTPGSLLIELCLMAALILFSRRSSSVTFTAGAAGLVVFCVAGAFVGFFAFHVIPQTVRPVLSITFAVFLVLAYRYINEEKEKEVWRRSFEAYFPPAVVRKIMAHPESIALSAQRKELTVLFSDIVSFTTHSSVLTPDRIRRFLNEYFDAMVDIVFKHGGTVDKYIGDGLMVFFGDPEPQEDHAARCVRAAIEMQQRARELHEAWRQADGFPLAVRIGINTGEVVVGNMGSRRQFSYTVLGSPVNLAQRLESNAPVGGILISDRTRELVKNEFPTKSLGEIKVKGIATPVAVHEVPVPPTGEDETVPTEGVGGPVQPGEDEHPTSPAGEGGPVPPADDITAPAPGKDDPKS